MSTTYNTSNTTVQKDESVIHTCDTCNKIFKTFNSYNKHINQQVCIENLKKTYCKICNKNFETRTDYESHTLSSSHISMINKNSFDNIIDLKLDETYDAQKIKNKNDLDPYLSPDEKMTLSDNTITIYYKNGQEEEQVIKEKKKKTKKDSLAVEINESKNISHDPPARENMSPISNVSSNEDINDLEEEKHNSKLRQKKILIFLKKNEKNEYGDKRFLKLLNKLNLDDYTGLNNELIRDRTINVLAKQKYLQAIKTFVDLLIKKKNEGNDTHNGHKIEDIVIKLTG